MNVSENVIRLQKSSHIIAVFAKISQILLLACFVLTFVGGGLCLFNDESATAISNGTAANTTFHLFFATFTLSDLLASRILLAISVILIVIFFSLAYAFFSLLHTTFEHISTSETPFTKENQKNLKKVIILCVIFIFLNGDLGFGFFAIFILYSFLLLFDYGCELQKQSDETL